MFEEIGPTPSPGPNATLHEYTIIQKNTNSYQSVNDVWDEVESLKSESDVLPVRINDDDGFVVAPRQEVIEAAVEHSVRRLCGGRTWRNCFIELVTIVTWEKKYSHIMEF